MRIGIVCSPTYGGSGVVATELGRFLAQRGHEVHFISIAMPFRLDPQPTQNIYFHEVQSMNYPVLPGELYGISIASKTVQVAQDYSLDIVHAHYAIPHAISAWLAREVAGDGCRRFKMVTTLHGTDITLVGRAPSFYPVAKFAIERSDAVTTVSSWLRCETIREFGVRREIEVIPNFVDESTFRRRPDCPLHSYFAPNGEKLLLHASNFRPVKRLPDVIHVFAKVRAQMPAKLLLIGDGPERDNASQLARTLKVQDDIFFLGKQERIEKFFACSDLMLFPSQYESFGLAALEAMAAENVVIASRGGGLPELIEHGVDGFLADVGDVETMAALAVEILRDDTRRKEMGKRARQKTIDKYEPAAIVPMYEQLYEKVLREAGHCF
jgi:N-acetyl-alpha-D-glucosaminyl L-malate synthase BshA